MAEHFDDISLTPKDFFESLSKSDHMLITLRDELYDGCWDTMIQDISNRIEGQPYVFKFTNRAEKDIESIRRLRLFEEEHDINLNIFLKKEH